MTFQRTAMGEDASGTLPVSQVDAMLGDHVWATVGDGASPVRVIRVAEE
jgi:hypothetical protein